MGYSHKSSTEYQQMQRWTPNCVNIEYGYCDKQISVHISQPKCSSIVLAYLSIDIEGMPPQCKVMPWCFAVSGKLVWLDLKSVWTLTFENMIKLCIPQNILYDFRENVPRYLRRLELWYCMYLKQCTMSASQHHWFCNTLWLTIYICALNLFWYLHAFYFESTWFQLQGGATITIHKEGQVNFM